MPITVSAPMTTNTAGGIALALEEHQHEAQAHVAADQFAHDHTDHGQRAGNAQAREQRRQGGRVLDHAEHLHAAWPRTNAPG